MPILSHILLVEQEQGSGWEELNDSLVVCKHDRQFKLASKQQTATNNSTTHWVDNTCLIEHSLLYDLYHFCANSKHIRMSASKILFVSFPFLNVPLALLLSCSLSSFLFPYPFWNETCHTTCTNTKSITQSTIANSLNYWDSLLIVGAKSAYLIVVGMYPANKTIIGHKINKDRRLDRRVI